jgi:predicted dehydrogenase
VLIGTFNADHAGIATRALQAGKAVFCEKPLATTLEDLESLTAARRAADRPFVVGFNLRYAPFYRAIHDRIQAGAIGRILSLEFNETLDPNHGAAMHGNWRRHRAKAGSFLMEKCCHDLDLCNWLVGDRVSRVASFGGLSFFTPENAHHRERIGPDAKGIPFYERGLRKGAYVGRCENIDPFSTDKDVVDHQVAILEYANGVRATFHLNAHAAVQERRFYLCGTEGALRGDLLSGSIEIRRTGWNTRTETIKPGTWDGHGGGDAVLARELAEVIRGQRETPTPFQAGVAATLTGLAIDEALDTGRVVDLAPYWSILGAKTG